MKFSVAAIVGVLATIVNAKPLITNTEFNVQAGKPFTLTWTNATGGVTIQLVAGDTSNLQPVGSPLITGATGGTASVTVPATTPSGQYAFEIIDENDPKDPNWSIKFDFKGSASAASSATSVVSTTTSVISSTSTSASSSASTTPSSSASSNSTTSTSTTTKASSTTSAKASTTTTPTNTNNGQRFASPLALVLVTVAALVCFN